MGVGHRLPWPNFWSPMQCAHTQESLVPHPSNHDLTHAEMQRAEPEIGLGGTSSWGPSLVTMQHTFVAVIIHSDSIGVPYSTYAWELG